MPLNSGDDQKSSPEIAYINDIALAENVRLYNQVHRRVKKVYSNENKK